MKIFKGCLLVSISIIILIVIIFMYRYVTYQVLTEFLKDIPNLQFRDNQEPEYYPNPEGNYTFVKYFYDTGISGGSKRIAFGLYENGVLKKEIVTNSELDYLKIEWITNNCIKIVGWVDKESLKELRKLSKTDINPKFYKHIGLILYYNSAENIISKFLNKKFKTNYNSDDIHFLRFRYDNWITYKIDKDYRLLYYSGIDSLRYQIEFPVGNIYKGKIDNNLNIIE